MKKIKICIWLTICLTSILLFVGNVKADAGYIIKTKNMKACAKIQNEYRHSLAKDGDVLKHENILVLESLNKEDIKSLKSEYGVDSVEKDIVISGFRTSNKKAKKKDKNSDWNMNMINIPKTKNDYSDVKVAVIDSGIDGTDFNVVVQRDFVDKEDIAKRFLFTDFSGHGTSVAGIIGAKRNKIGITGVAPNASIYSAKVLDANNEAPLSRIIQAIYWAVENDVNIINMSFGTSGNSKILKEAIQYAYNNNTILIASAGNNDENGSSDIIYPAAYNEVLSVGSVDSNADKSEFSVIGNVDVMAPGNLVITSGAFDGTIVESGTSISVPHVAGLAAIIKSRYPKLTNGAVYDIIKKGCKKSGEYYKYGYGIIDVKFSLSLAKNYADNETILEGKEIVNKEKIEIYDELSAVKGMWSKTKHLDIATNAVLGKGLLGVEIKYVKIGSVLQDIIYSGYGADLENKHPYFHGNGNYLAFNLYLRDVAKKIVTSTSGTYANNINSVMYKADLDTTWKNKCRDDLINLPWIKIQTNYAGLDDFLKNNNLSVANVSNIPNIHKGYIILGMAIHQTADVFAHEAYVNDTANGNYNNIYTYTRLLHSDVGNGSDTWGYFPQRNVCAQIVANQIISEFVSSSSVTLSPWKIGTATIGNSFRLNSTSTYASAIRNYSGMNISQDLSDSLYIITYLPDERNEMLKRIIYGLE